MTNISIESFRQTAQVEGKIALDQNQEGGLKTYGNKFMGKVSCWFQSKSSRVEQSNQVRQSFIDAIKSKYGEDMTGDVIAGLRSNMGKRLSSRTVSQTIANLDKQQQVNQQANNYASTRYSTILTGQGRTPDCFESNFSSIATKLGFSHTDVTKMMGETGIEGVQDKVKQAILTAGKGGNHRVSPSGALKIAKTEIQAHLLTQMMLSGNKEQIGKALDQIHSLNRFETTEIVRTMGSHLAKEGETGFKNGVTIGKLLVQKEIDKSTDKGSFMRGENPSSRFNITFINALGSNEINNITKSVVDAFKEQSGTNPYLTATKDEFREMINKKVESELGPRPDPSIDLEGATQWDNLRSEVEKEKRNEANETLSKLFYQNVLGKANQLPDNVKTFLKEMRSVCSEQLNVTKFGTDMGKTMIGDNMFLRTLFPNCTKTKSIMSAQLQLLSLQNAISFTNSFVANGNPDPQTYSLPENTSERMSQFIDQISK